MSGLQLQNSKSVIQAKDAAIQELKERVSYLEAEVGPGILGAGSEFGLFGMSGLGLGMLGLGSLWGWLGNWEWGKSRKKVGKAGEREEKGGRESRPRKSQKTKKKNWIKTQIPNLSLTISARISEIPGKFLI